jgi:hypothetical protein
MKEAKNLKQFHCAVCLGEIPHSPPNKKCKITKEKEPYSFDDFEYFTGKLLGEIESSHGVIDEFKSQFSTLLNIQKLLEMEEDSNFQELRNLTNKIE